MTASVAPFLADFAVVARGVRQLDPLGAHEDVERRLEAARAEGRETGEAVANARFEAELAAERRRFELALAQARSAWATDEGERLAGQIAAVEARLAESIVRALEPLLPELARAKALDDVVEAVGTVLRPGGAVLLEISGPVELIDALRKKLGERGAAIEYWPSAGPEIRVIAEDTVIETALAPLLARLREAAA